MKTLAVAFLSSLLIAVTLTPVVRKVALSLGLTDDREAERKVHRSRVSRLGGLVMFVAFLLPLAGLYFYDNGVAKAVFGDMGRFSGFLLLAAAAFFIGLSDDLKPLSPRLRLAGQFAIGAASFFAGFRFESVSLFGQLIHFSPAVAFAVTVLWFVLIINAINLIDGLDGLAGGIVSIATATVFTVSVMHGAVLLSVTTALLLGSLAGFLYHNFKPSCIFMGDGGSYFLGYAIAALTLDASMKSAAACVVLLPLLALGVPIFDTVFAFFRRLWRGIPITHADKEHIHHRLLRMGFTSSQAVAVLYMLTTALCLLALASVGASLPLLPASLVVAGTGAAVVTALTGVKGLKQAVRLVFDKYADRRRRFRAVDAAWRAARSGEPLPEVFRLCVAACEVLRCDGLALSVVSPAARPLSLSWRASDLPSDALTRKLTIPIETPDGRRGEVTFSIVEDLADVFNRDKDYFDTLSRALAKAAERPEAALPAPEAVPKPSFSAPPPPTIRTGRPITELFTRRSPRQ